MGRNKDITVKKAVKDPIKSIKKQKQKAKNHTFLRVLARVDSSYW